MSVPATSTPTRTPTQTSTTTATSTTTPTSTATSTVAATRPSSPSASRRLVESFLAQAGIAIGGGNPWDLQVYDERFFDRVLSQGSLGLGESTMDGWCDCARFDEFVARVLPLDPDRVLKRPLRDALVILKAKLLNLQSVRRAPDIVRHYDYGNSFFEKLLGPTMNYSCAYWARARTLDEAQEHKIELICKKLGLREGDRVLDVGCGWGTLARYAAERYGCRVTGITLAQEQLRYAKERGRDGSVSFLLCDYRSPEMAKLGPFDKIVSVGMFEHVGKKNHRTFMEVMRQLLAPGGLLLLHTMGHCHSDDVHDPFIERYVFPNHLVPSVGDIASAIHRLFVLEDWHNFGADYGRTLMSWHENFQRMIAAGEGPADARTQRMWRFYLLGLAGAFRCRVSNQLWQIVLSRDGVPGGYVSVR